MNSIPTISPATREFFKGISSSILTDSMERLGVGAWMDGVRPLTPSARLSGRVRTLQFGIRTGVRHCSESTYSFAETFEADDVMVIGSGGSRGWLFGANVVNFLIARGVAGIVTDGHMRDQTELTNLPMPIFCRGATARPFKGEVEVIATDVPLECGGAHLRPGDLILGDADGIAVAPSSVIDSLISEAEELIDLERQQAAAISEGRSFSEIRAIINLRKRRAGVDTGGQSQG